jgi:hypothetical protein
MRRVREEQDTPGALDRQPRDVGGDEDATAIVAVRHHPAHQREDEERHELGTDHEPHRLYVAAGFQHREGQRHEHDAVADQREHLAGEQQAEIAPRCARRQE